MEALEKDTRPWIEAIDFENRRYPRVDIHLPVEHDQIKSSFTHIGNLSEGGLLIYFPEETDVKQYLRLKLFFSLRSELETIKMMAEVVWKDNHLSNGGKYSAYGLRFVYISLEDMTKLRNFLSSLSSPLDDILCPFNTLKARFWVQKFMNLRREYILRRQRPEIFSSANFPMEQMPISEKVN